LIFSAEGRRTASAVHRPSVDPLHCHPVR